MDNSLNLLNEILGIVSRIEQNSRSQKAFSSSDSKIESKETKFNSGTKSKETDLFKGNKDVSKISADSIKNMGTAIGTFASGVSSYMAIRILGGTKILKEITSFLQGLESINTEKVNITGQTIASIGHLLDVMSPKKLMGLMMLGKAAKSSSIKELVLEIGEALSAFDKDNPVDKAKSFTLIIHELTNKETISGLKKLGKLNPKDAENLGKYMKALTNGLDKIPNTKSLERVANSVNLLTKSLLYIVGAIGAIVLIGAVISMTENPMEILGYSAALLLVSVGLLHFCISEANRLKKSGEAIGNLSKALLSLTGVIATVTLIGSLLLLTGKPLEILGLSALVMIAVVGVLGLAIYASNFVKKSNGSILTLANAMLALTKVVAIVSLIGALLLLTGKPLEILGLTTLIIGLEIGTLLLISKGAEKIKGTEKSINNLAKMMISATACIGVIILIAAVLSATNNPLEILGLAALVIVGMIGMISLIALADKVLNFEKAGKGLINLGKGMLLLSLSLAAMALCISFAIVPLIEKINNTEGFWDGLGAIAAVVGGLMILSTVLGFLLDSKSTSKVLTLGAIAMFGLALVMWSISLALDPIIEASSKIGNQPGTFWIGFGSIVGVLVITSLITAAIGALMSSGAGLLIGGLGIIAMLGLAEVMKSLSSAIDPIIESSLKLGSQGVEFWSGLGDIAKVLGLTGLALTAAGLLAVPMAAGEIVLAGLGKVLKVLGSGLDQIIEIGLKVGNNKDMISENLNGVSKVIVSVIDSLSEIGIGGGIKATALGKTLKPLFETLGMYTDIIMKLSSNTFVKGYDDKGKPIYEKIDLNYALAGSSIGLKFVDFIEALLPVLDKVDKDKTKLIKKLGESLNPIMDSLSKYADVITKMADPSGIYIVKGYDENGRPIYSDEKVDFNTIATNISISFISFIDMLSIEMDKIKIESTKKMKKIGDALEPIMEVLAIYVRMLEKMGDTEKIIKATNISGSVADSIKGVIIPFMDEAFINDVSKYYGGTLAKSNFGKILSAIEDIEATFNAYLKMVDVSAKIKDDKAKATADNIIQTIKIFMDKAFMDQVSDFYGEFYERSKFDTLRKSIDDIADVFKAYQKIVDASAIKGPKPQTASDLVSLVKAFASDNVITNINTFNSNIDSLISIGSKLDKFDSSNISKLEKFLEQFKPAFQTLEEMTSIKLDEEDNILRHLDSLNSFLKTDFSLNSNSIEDAAGVFDKALLKIDESLQRNRQARLAAMREFSKGALELASSIDHIYTASNKATSNADELKGIIRDLKDIEKSRLEDSTIKLQYEQQLSSNREKEHEIVKSTVEVIEKANTNTVNNTTTINNNNSQDSERTVVGLNAHQMQIFAQYIAQEVSQAVITGLTTGIKKFSFDFRNSTEELVGNLHLE